MRLVRRAWRPFAFLGIWALITGGILLLLRGEERFPSDWQDLSGGLPAYAPVTGLAVSAADNDLALASIGREGAVLITSDGGLTWRTGRGMQDVVGYGVALDPLVNTRAYVAAADGAYRSRDSGYTWERMAVALRPALAVLVDSRQPGRILVGGRGGVQVSSDLGDTWQQGSGWSEDETARAITLGPSGLFYAGGNGGVRRSDDGGLTWERMNAAPANVDALLADPGNGLRVLALTQGALMASEDAGRTWRPVPPPVAGARLLSLALNESRANALLAGTAASGLWSSADDGQTWTRVGTLPQSNITAVARSIQKGNIIWSATPAGILRSTDGGQNWTRPIQYPIRPIVRTIAYSATQARLYAGTTDGVFALDEQGKWASTGPALSGEAILALGQEGAGGAVRYAATLGKGLQISDDYGLTWRSPPDDAGLTTVTGFAGGTSSSVIVARVANQRLLRSEDGGDHWQGFDQGLEGLSVYALTAVVPATRVYAGTSAGVFRLDSPDGSWQPTSGSLPPGSVLSIAADPKNLQRVWAGHTTGLYASEDGGRTWSGPAPSLGARTVRAILLDLPWMYAGMEQDGVFISKDAGKTWRRLGRIPLGYPINQFSTDRFSGDLYVATDLGVYRWPAGQH